MRPAIRKHFAATFRSKFENLFPQFTWRKLEPGSPGYWEWRVAKGLVFFVYPHPFKDHDEFVLEVAWAETEEFPWSVSSKQNPAELRGRFRLGQLPNYRGEEHVWVLAPEVRAATQAYWEALDRDEPFDRPPPPSIEIVLPRIEPMVDDCLKQFQKHGMSVLKKVAKHRGLVDVF